MSREAMQMALEALEDANDVARMEFSDENYYSEAINALRQALVDADDTSKERVDEKAKREQEPVAHIDHRIHSWPDCFVIRADPPHTSPLYLSLPKREWVGLTDDAVFELADTNLYDGGKNYGVLAFAKAIEQSLKEKNYG